jgi:hypothetical protein
MGWSETQDRGHEVPPVFTPDAGQRYAFLFLFCQQPCAAPARDSSAHRPFTYVVHSPPRSKRRRPPATLAWLVGCGPPAKHSWGCEAAPGLGGTAIGDMCTLLGTARATTVLTRDIKRPCPSHLLWNGARAQTSVRGRLGPARLQRERLSAPFARMLLPEPRVSARVVPKPYTAARIRCYIRYKV